MITISAFRWVPPFARGLVRDLRVRWALEEAGLPYEVKLVEPGGGAAPDYRACQPFGQVPYLEENGLVLFESGAIVLYVGGRSEALLPKDDFERARAVTWVFAALNTMEVVVQGLASLDLFYKDQAWAKERRPAVEQDTRRRLGELAGALDAREYLDQRFTAGDLVMTTVLQNLRQTDLLSGYPTLAAYKARCEARPAFQRALRAQTGDFENR